MVNERVHWTIQNVDDAVTTQNMTVAQNMAVESRNPLQNTKMHNSLDVDVTPKCATMADCTLGEMMVCRSQCTPEALLNGVLQIKLHNRMQKDVAQLGKSGYEVRRTHHYLIPHLSSCSPSIKSS